LEDFSRLWIYLGGLHDLIVSGDIRVGLRWKNVTPGTTPAINIYPSADETGSDSYLKDDAAAQAQITGVFNDAVRDQFDRQTVDTSSTFVFKTDYWHDLTGDNPKKCLLFEGAAEGKGELEIVFIQGSTVIGHGASVWLDLKNIKDMYKRLDISGEHQWPLQIFEPPADETDTGIMFVHGWNVSPDGASAVAETMFKRVWWRGFKGRFTAFRWNTHWAAALDNVPFIGEQLDAYLADFNDSEHRAWLAGSLLKFYIENSTATHLNLVAHSMGNIVAGSALRKGGIVENYAMLHAAVPASRYDERFVLRQPIALGVLNKLYWDTPTPDDDDDIITRSLAYRGQLAQVQGNLINFCLPEDRATTLAWEFNNDSLKPTLGFGYERNAMPGSKLRKLEAPGVYRPLTDPEEAMPYADQSWSKAAGAEPRTAGVVGATTNLSDEQYSLSGGSGGFNDEHGAEFDRSYQQLQTFYRDLLRRLNLPQNE